MAEAVELAKGSDCVILCLGETSEMSGEGMSRSELRLSEAQKTLVREIVRVNENTAAVIFCGRPLVLTDIIDDMPSCAIAWQPGTEGGNAIANLLFGKTNFSGKLPMSFPRSEGQLPISYNVCRTGRPWEGPYASWYQDMPKTPLYPFGYGLSYTNFKISAPVLSKTEMQRGETIEITAEIENVGKISGEEVVQLYICDDFASLVRPVKELKGYQKVALAPNERKTVTFTITEETLAFWTEKKKFEAESGTFTVYLSNSSEIEKGIKFKLL